MKKLTTTIIPAVVLAFVLTGCDGSSETSSEGRLPGTEVQAITTTTTLEPTEYSFEVCREAWSLYIDDWYKLSEDEWSVYEDLASAKGFDSTGTPLVSAWELWAYPMTQAEFTEICT